MRIPRYGPWSRGLSTLGHKIAVLCAALLVAGLLPPSTAAAVAPGSATELAVPAKYRNQQVSWNRCYDDALLTALGLNVWPYNGLYCASIKAPVDWHNPDAGPDVTIKTTRLLPRSGSVPARTLVSNPGGPGGSGTSMPLYFGLRRPEMAQNFQLIGFDPRGTTDSSNISCLGAPNVPGDVRDQDRARLDLVARASRLVGDYCHEVSGNLINFVTTEQTVQDIELIRILFGQDKLDWIGYSGGTWMGAYYATYFPQHTGRFVLDSNADFTASWDRTFNAQPQAFERRFREDFAPWVARYHQYFHDLGAGLGVDLGSTAGEVIAFYENLRAAYQSNPVKYLGLLYIDGNFIDRQIISAMYSKANFRNLAALLITLRAIHNLSSPAAAAQTAQLPTELRRMLAQAPHPLTVSPDSSSATFYAITCNDTAWAGGRNTGNHLASDLGPKYPLVGWSINFNPCYDWDRPQLALKQPTGVGVPQVLMIQSTHDPATAFEAASAAHRNFAGSVLVTVENEGDHGIYGGTNECVNTLVERFLVTGALPAGDTTCQGVGLPNPQPSAGVANTGTQVNPLAELAKIDSPIDFAIQAAGGTS